MKLDLSPRDLAQATGVSESTVKRWVDGGRIAAIRTVGGHRRIERVEAVRFVRANSMPVRRPDLLGMATGGGQERQDLTGRRARLLFEALRDGDGRQAAGLVGGWFTSDMALSAIFDGPVRWAMHRIGRFWEQDSASVYLEHRATDICIQAVAQVRLALPAPVEGAPVAIGGAPSGDPYLLPSMLVATVLADMGWETISLGPDTPPAAFALAIRQHRPALVWMSLTSAKAARRAGRTLSLLAGRLAYAGTPLVVGGQAATPALLARHAGCRPIGSLAELAGFATGLRAAGA